MFIISRSFIRDTYYKIPLAGAEGKANVNKQDKDLFVYAKLVPTFKSQHKHNAAITASAHGQDATAYTPTHQR